jgi:hypothetical protein
MQISVKNGKEFIVRMKKFRWKQLPFRPKMPKLKKISGN